MALYINVVELSEKDAPSAIRRAYKQSRINSLPIGKRKSAMEELDEDECDYEDTHCDMDESVKRVTPKVTSSDLPPAITKKAGPPVAKVSSKKPSKAKGK